MAVLVVASILAVLAAPSLNGFIANQRISNQVNELLGDLNFARSEAIKRAVTITVCKSADPDSAAPTCNANAGDPWRSGRIVFVDSTNIGTRDANEQILRVRQELDGVSSTANTIVGDAIEMGKAGAFQQLSRREYRQPCDFQSQRHDDASGRKPVGRLRQARQ